MHKNPLLAVDIIIKYQKKIVLIERKNPPFGLALPGGFVDAGETVEQAARREAMEETGLTLSQLELQGIYSDPLRDPRGHTVSVVFCTSGSGTLQAGDDAARTILTAPDKISHPLAFDHSKIIADYLNHTSPQNFRKK